MGKDLLNLFKLVVGAAVLAAIGTVHGCTSDASPDGPTDLSFQSPRVGTIDYHSGVASDASRPTELTIILPHANTSATSTTSPANAGQ